MKKSVYNNVIFFLISSKSSDNGFSNLKCYPINILSTYIETDNFIKYILWIVNVQSSNQWWCLKMIESNDISLFLKVK
jgi:hypothetical protein